MKRTLLLFVPLLLVLSACGPTKKDVVAYDEKINDLYESFSNVYAEYALKANTDSAALIEDYRVYACRNIIPHIDSVSKIGDFYGDKEYAEALKTYLLVVQKTMQTFDGEKIRILMKDSLMTAQDSVKVQILRAKTINLTNDAYLNFLSAQKNFREKNKIANIDK